MGNTPTFESRQIREEQWATMVYILVRVEIYSIKKSFIKLRN